MLKMSNDIPKNFKETVKLYWFAYGSWQAFFCSPYLWISLVITAVSVNLWKNNPWWDTVLQVMPNTLGFTLGGLAIFIGMGNEKFQELICGNTEAENGEPSPYISSVATFLHFILIQTLAILSALAAKALMFPTPELLIDYAPILIKLGIIGSALGFWLFIYGICTASAAAINLFVMSKWFDMMHTVNNKNEKDKP